MRPETLRIPATLRAISERWREAEGTLIQLVRTKYFDLDEETLTTLFSRELVYEIEVANRSRVFENAFLKDIQKHFAKYSAKLKMRLLVLRNLYHGVEAT